MHFYDYDSRISLVLKIEVEFWKAIEATPKCAVRFWANIDLFIDLLNPI